MKKHKFEVMIESEHDALKQLILLLKEELKNDHIKSFEVLDLKDEKWEEKEICSICKCRYEGFGHNAQPVNAGRCCDVCNDLRVIPARIKEVNNK